ncbi:signal transduction histidine kinase [Saccharopolyspora lacisalsi]|uniref:histidine kinase n=1 Tax=Halosaccharopolyspora lacisalsi TaxID=1000566 RepID=A0A839DZX7_9PSEU|nr:ATP-binding protein [Halosaccharopolyspora lacisalsi]MBA8824975.1 signal transduction histidine kinase [Halosaccharopolyspora lacisalsi]
MTDVFASIFRRYGTTAPRPAMRSAGMAALVVAGSVALARQHQRVTALRADLRNREARLRGREQELHHLITERLPALAESLRTHTVEGPGPLGTDDPSHAESLETLMRTVDEALRHMRDRVEQSATQTLTGVLATVRGLAAEQHTTVAEMQHRHDDAHVLADLYRIDHASSQLTRRLRALAVLFGAWIGQQRSTTNLHEIIRGAQAQIRDYQRITINPHAQDPGSPVIDDLGIVSRAVEPLVLIIAELLDNGARYSPPYAQVTVGFQAAHHGIAVTVDDAGVGMPLEERQRATRLLTQGSATLGDLDDPPRVGFAVVGLLAARYGCTVSVDAPPLYGGVRAVVFVPNELLTHDAPNEPASRQEPEVPAEVPTQHTSGGLPKRTRRTHAPDTAEPNTAAVTDSAGSAAGLAAWQQASTAAHTSSTGENEERNTHS